MFKLEPRPQASKFWSYGSPLLALVITVLIGVALFIALGKDPVKGLQVFFWEPVKTPYALGELMVKATPLLVIALGALSRGDLGAERLIGMGPVLLNLLWLAPLPMLVGGAGEVRGHLSGQHHHLGRCRLPEGRDQRAVVAARGVLQGDELAQAEKREQAEQDGRAEIGLQHQQHGDQAGLRRAVHQLVGAGALRRDRRHEDDRPAVTGRHARAHQRRQAERALQVDAHHLVVQVFADRVDRG